MVLKCVRYLGQQGYGTDDIVVLTPYLGQLFLLVKTLSNENDPILNDLDSYELIRAGLVTPASANISKRKLRISTIGEFISDCVLIMVKLVKISRTCGCVLRPIARHLRQTLQYLEVC
jgi:hypothetical protein